VVRREVRCLLIDALDAPRGWDRATAVHERSLEIFEALGVADQLLAGGVRTRGALVHSGGATVGEQSLYLPKSRYGYQLGVSEEVTESRVTDYLEAHGGAVTRSTRLLSLEPAADAVTAIVERDGECREVRVEWVVGCDGYHSAVRKAVGIAFHAADIDAPWAVVDATAEGWTNDYDMVSVHLDQPPVLLTPLPGRR
jgi:2-polyprenyl-6-methoxyphenol hydroxylase-like FAD-dependent oxidoreductase